MVSAFLTPPEAAKLLRVDPHKVVAWIRAGELRASNVATKRGGRPRWRISETDLEAFLASRVPDPPLPRAPRRGRRAEPSDFIKYF